MSASVSLKLPSEKSLLKLKVGDEVALSESDFARLSKAFFAELEKKVLVSGFQGAPISANSHLSVVRALMGRWYLT